jgi:alkylated DNA nucleotide flippase Atl1
MALGYAVALREAQLNQITTRQDGGTGASLLRIYDSTGAGRPATGGAITTQVLLAELTFADPSYAAAGTPTPGALAANAIVQDSSANNTGTATWFRVVQSDGTTHVMDGSISTTGSDLNLNSVSITAGGTVSVTSWVITAGNA